MEAERIKDALKEANRFIRAAVELGKAKAAAEGSPNYTPSCPRESGALRRASLDLTRALARMRSTK